jgi:hypothetical protein
MIDTHILDKNTSLQSDSSTKTMWFRLARLCTITMGRNLLGKRDSLGMDPIMVKFETSDEFLNYTPTIGGDFLFRKNQHEG